MKDEQHYHLRLGSNRLFYQGPKYKCPICNSRKIEASLRGFLSHHHGSLRESTVRNALGLKFAQADISDALQAFRGISLCRSCGCIISMRTPHQEPCPHSAVDLT